MKKIICVGLVICSVAIYLFIPTNINNKPIVSATSLHESIINPDLELEIIGRNPERFDDPDIKIYSTATLDDNFCASSIMIIKKASHSQVTTESTPQDSIMRGGSYVFGGIGLLDCTMGRSNYWRVSVDIFAPTGVRAATLNNDFCNYVGTSSSGLLMIGASKE